MNNAQSVLIFGATGQQGGSVARALLHRGWRVRALVRDPFSAGAVALAARGAELVVGTFEDRAAGETPIGVAHYDTKAEIERHIRRLPLAATIVRPATFMELLVMPGFGLDEGHFHFFMLPEGRMQVLAVEDIGHLVAAVFAAPARFAGKTFEIASDSVTGRQLEALFSAAAGRPIPYSRFSDEVLAASPFLHKLTGLVDDGRLAGHADLDAMRQLHPQLHTFAGWLSGPGRPAFERALTSGANWAFNR